VNAGAQPRPAAVEARGWGWRHAGRRDWAVRGLDLRIEAGERVLLLGGSGAGKSTLLLGIGGLLDPSGGGEQEGSLQVGGKAPAAARENTGILFQDPEAQLVMGRAGDDVAFGLENRCLPSEAIWPRVDAALDAVGFRYGRERSTDALSAGEQQRLALAGVIAVRPALLLLDEPSANLDPAAAGSIRDLIGELVRRRSMTLLLVEHRVGEWLPLIDRVVVIEPGGGVYAEGRPLELFARLGDQLASAGVWVPDRRVVRRRSPTPKTPETMVLADGVGLSYPGSSRPALSGVDLRIRSSEALAVVGPNGAGKSTLALLLAGLLTPTTGIIMAGEALAPGRSREPIARWPARELVKRIGTVFQDPEHQFLTRRVIDELLLGPQRAGIEPALARRRAEELLGRLRLSHLADANPFTLSGGEKRRLSVATALATAPAVLVLDEPTFGQDLRTWIELLDLLAALRDEGRAICFVTHDRDFAHALADRTLRLAVR
jgi:energy-coupling factor transport system ATP-binding protein